MLQLSDKFSFDQQYCSLRLMTLSTRSPSLYLSRMSGCGAGKCGQAKPVRAPALRLERLTTCIGVA